MTPLIQGQCVQTLLRRGSIKSSLCYQRFELNIGSRRGTEILPSGHKNSRRPGNYWESQATSAEREPVAGSGRKVGRQGCKLLVLGLGRQRLMGFGVVDDLAQQLLPERRQRSFPQLPRGLALLDEDPFLGGDRAGIHAIGEMIDGAAGDRIAFADGPF